MTPELLGLFGILALLVLTFARVPIGAAMGLVGLIGYAMIDGWHNAFMVFGDTAYGVTTYGLSVLPLFLLMGNIATRSGMSEELFRAANAIFAGSRGALCTASIGGCAGFAAVSGSSIATAGTFTQICVPEMRRYGYDFRLAIGSVAAGGTLGILIPPSSIMVIYALSAEVSVPALFAAGLLPGILLALLFVVVVQIVVRMRPDWAPATDPLPMRDRLKAVASLWKVAVLFGVSVGGIYMGWFSPTEAAGVASFIAMIIGFATRQLTFAGLNEAIVAALRTTSMLLFIMLGAWVFSYFVVQTGVSRSIVELVTVLDMPPWMVILVVLGFYVVLGCFLDSVAIILVTVPIFLPLVVGLGYDPVWYGVLMIIVVEIGLITPPVGLNLFVIRAQLPEVPLSVLFRGVVPFFGAYVVLIAALMLFPQIALWLPSVLY